MSREKCNFKLMKQSVQFIELQSHKMFVFESRMLGKLTFQHLKWGEYTYLVDIFPVWIQQKPTLNFKDRLHALAQDQEQ